MAKVIPFRGLRYDTEKSGTQQAVTAPPYDIISKAEQDALYERSEYNVIRLEYGRDCDGDGAANNKYIRAGETLKSWIGGQVLKFEDEPAFYIYEQVFSLQENVLKSLKGIISLAELVPFSEGIVLPHEQTLSKAKEDRFNLMNATGANFSQIYSLYLDEEGTVRDIISAQSSEAPPDVSFTTADGIVQNLWIIKDSAVNAKLTELFANKQLFIADGHHRYETALKYRDKCRAENPGHTGAESFNYVMMMLVDMEDDGLVVFPTHRLIKDLEGFDEVNLIGMLTENFNVSKIHFTDKDYVGVITDKMNKTLDEKMYALYTGGSYYYHLELKSLEVMETELPDMSAAYRNLDVTVLHTLILEKLLGIDKENMARQINLTYTRDINEAVTGVAAGNYQCSFILNPTKVSEIKDVSLANEKMPQKSTYFWPKLVTGIVMNKF